jgi:membrane protein YdbS with pleckstrin-like domain
MGKGAKFCPHCGTPVSSGFQASEKGEPILLLRPKFLGLVSAFSILPLQIFFTIWGVLMFGGISTLAVKALNLDLPPGAPFVFFGCLFFFGIPIVAFVAKKKSYAKTEYRFYPTELDYYEGFFTTEEKTINYKNVNEIYLRRGIFQKMYGLGTIVLSTPATGSEGSGRARSGVRVADIENPDLVYSQIKELVSRVS